MNNRYFPAQRRYRADFDPTARAAAVVDNESFARPRLVRCDAEPFAALRRDRARAGRSFLSAGPTAVMLSAVRRGPYR
jgi:hypothetical protein